MFFSELKYENFWTTEYSEDQKLDLNCSPFQIFMTNQKVAGVGCVG